MKIPIFLSFLFIIANAGKRFDKSLIISMPVYISAAPQKVDTERWKTDGKWLPLQADRVVRPVERA